MTQASTDITNPVSVYEARAKLLADAQAAVPELKQFWEAEPDVARLVKVALRDASTKPSKDVLTTEAFSELSHTLHRTAHYHNIPVETMQTAYSKFTTFTQGIATAALEAPKPAKEKPPSPLANLLGASDPQLAQA